MTAFEGAELEAGDRLLTTTRAIRRRLDLDAPVDLGVVHRCLELALQAPSGGNSQNWRWMVVADEKRRLAVAEAYRAAEGGRFTENAARAREAGDEQTAKVYEGAVKLRDDMHRVPVLVVPCVLGRVDGADNAGAAGFYASILPAVWSLMLALRARGLGTTWTSVHLSQERAVGEALGIPDDVSQVALIPVGAITPGPLSPARRRPVEEVAYLDSWGEPFTG